MLLVRGLKLIFFIVGSDLHHHQSASKNWARERWYFEEGSRKGWSYHCCTVYYQETWNVQGTLLFHIWQPNSKNEPVPFQKWRHLSSSMANTHLQSSLPGSGQGWSVSNSVWAWTCICQVIDNDTLSASLCRDRNSGPRNKCKHRRDFGTRRKILLFCFNLESNLEVGN